MRRLLPLRKKEYGFVPGKVKQTNASCSAKPRGDDTFIESRSIVGECLSEHRSTFTQVDPQVSRIKVHVGISGLAGNDRGNHDDQLHLDFSLSGDLGAIAAHVIEAMGPYLRQAVADSTANCCPTLRMSHGPEVDDRRPSHPEFILSGGAKSLLKTIVDIALRAEVQELPQEAWISFSSWFDIAEMVERHREDAESLIAELTNVGFVEIHNTPKRKKYKATIAGRRYLKSLDR